MPPLMAIAIMKKLVKGLTLVLTAAVIGVREQSTLARAADNCEYLDC